MVESCGIIRGPRVREQAEIHRHSGWLIPLGFFLVIAVLSALFLAYYLRPLSGVFQGQRSGPAVETLNLGDMELTVPANYLERSGTRRNNTDMVALFALLPDLRGFSAAEAALFAGDAADSSLVHLLIRADAKGLDSADRFARIYRPNIVDAQGEAGPFGLTRYQFRADSGYGGQDLYAGIDAARGVLLLLCQRPAQDLPSPNCLAIDRPIAPGLSLSYRFKRAQLARWRDISAGVTALVSGFVRH